MIIYRISNSEYSHDISGNGAAIYGARWNSPGNRLLYTSSFISLCILESLVHVRQNYIPGSQYLLQIGIPDSINNEEIILKKMKTNWQRDIAYSQWIGDQFVKSNECLVMKVPSAIVPEEHNFLINPLHRDFNKVKIIGSELLNLDKRLLSYE